MTPAVEEVARAIADAERAQVKLPPYSNDDWDARMECPILWPDLEAKARAALAAAEAVAWQPIETAPKDGTQILGFLRFHDVATWMDVIYWWNDPDENDDGWMITADEDELAGVDPTHWRPLPAPPVAS